MNPAVLTVTAGNASRAYGAANPTFTVNYSGFVNGDTRNNLITRPTASTTATSASPAGIYAITPGGGVSPNYTFNYVAGTLTVGQATLTITANNQTKVYGFAMPPLTVSFSGFVNGDTQNSLTTQPTIGTTATATSAAGNYPITASGAVDPNYLITYGPGTLSVTPATLTITANNLSKTYGAVNPPLTFGYSGFVNGDTPASLSSPVTASTTATTNSPAGVYLITPSGGVDPNYNFVYNTGNLTVGQAVLTITANNQSKAYGTALPTLTIGYSGFVNGDTNTSLTTQPTINTTGTASSNVGTYPITVGGAASGNYAINYVQGNLTVTPVVLTITADNQTKAYGAALPAFTASYSGFVNGDTQASLTVPPTVFTTATATSPAGLYTIRARSAVDPNYTIAYVNGTLTIGQVALNIAANNASKAYGAANPAFTATYTGFVNGEGPASLTTQPTIASAADATSAVGTYPITASGATSTNYAITYTPGTLTVGQSPLTITANNVNKTYGATLTGGPGSSAFTATGLQNGQTIGGVTIAYGTGAAAGDAVGSYPGSVTPSAATGGSFTAGNYNISYATGNITVGQANLTITANNQTKAQGAVNPTLTINYSGFVNSETNAVLSTQPTYRQRLLLVRLQAPTQ